MTVVRLVLRVWLNASRASRNVGINEFHVCGRVFCLPSGTEPFAATFQVDPHGSQLTLYRLRFGNKSESDDVKREQFVHKAPTDAARWDFEFRGP